MPHDSRESEDDFGDNKSPIVKPVKEEVIKYGGGTITGYTNMPDPIKANMTTQEKADAGRKTAFRFIMYQALQLVKGLCGSFEQTTHGAFWHPDKLTIEEFCNLFSIAWNEPTAYNISNLAQFINQFKRKGW